jgi:hypothetical protein
MLFRDRIGKALVDVIDGVYNQISIHSRTERETE